MAASITRRAEVDRVLIAIATRKEPRHQIQVPIPTVRLDEELFVASFDGSARVKRGGVAYSAILWKLPEWSVVRARSGYVEGLTANEEEYHGLLLCMDLLEGEDPRKLVICGDSNLKALDRLRIWPHHEQVHVKRDWNSSADSLACAALQRQGGILVDEAKDLEDLEDLVTLNCLDEILVSAAEVDDS
ncbi:hypothetical protein ON010_g7690 [Phytophthora cinnamomi]|nr:hypothetical protein ON010_g7690 [Phytophthora cinnamomi]